MTVPADNDPSKAATPALPATDDAIPKKQDDQIAVQQPQSPAVSQTSKTSENDYAAMAAAWIGQGDKYAAIKHYAADVATTTEAKLTSAIYNATPESLRNAFDKIAAYAHRRPDNDYGGACATIIRTEYLQPAGIMSTTDPHGNAFNYSAFMEKKGYKDIRDGWSLETARPGDMVVFDRTKLHPDGHVQVMGKDGRWYSDCKQERFLPNQRGFGAYHVYRTAEPPTLAPSIMALNDKAAPTPDTTAALTGGRRGNYQKLATRYAHNHASHHAGRELASTDAPVRMHGPRHGRGAGHGPGMA